MKTTCSIGEAATTVDKRSVGIVHSMVRHTFCLLYRSLLLLFSRSPREMMHEVRGHWQQHERSLARRLCWTTSTCASAATFATHPLPPLQAGGDNAETPSASGSEAPAVFAHRAAHSCSGDNYNHSSQSTIHTPSAMSGPATSAAAAQTTSKFQSFMNHPAGPK